MKIKILTIAFLFAGLNVFGQINMADSTVQVITYWSKGEKQNYTVSLETTKVEGTDTVSKELISYDIEITVLDETKDSYTIEWLYKNATTTSKDAMSQRILDMAKNSKIVYKTDEMGTFLELVNWKEVRDYIRKTTATLRKDFKQVPEIAKITKQIETTYATKESIEASCIKEIQQFHGFFGGKYELGEIIEGLSKAPNIYGKEPFDLDFIVLLDEINPEDEYYIMRSSQRVDQEQLTDAVFNYLTGMAKNMNVAPPKLADMQNLKNETNTVSIIDNTGWIIYSIQILTVNLDGTSNIEKRIIEIK